MLIMLLFCGACDVSQPLKVEKTNNPEYSAMLLFEHEGCKVFAFDDEHRTHYFVKCANNSSTSQHNLEHCGKGCVRHYEEQINTSQE